MNLRWFLSLAMLLSMQLSAQNAYKINITLKPFHSGYLYLASYYGKKQLLIDSAAIDKNSQAIFSGKEKLPGGIYLIAFPKKDGWFEIVIDKEQVFTIMADSADLLNKLTFTGSTDNQLFKDYQKFTAKTGAEIAQLQRSYAQAKNKKDSAAIYNTLQMASKSLKTYRLQFIKEHPKHILSSIFAVLNEPLIPSSLKDSVSIYMYYRTHFWDGVDMTDARLIRTPVFQIKLDRYFDDVLPQDPDSLKIEANDIILKARPNKDMYQYVLSQLTEKYVSPKYMGQDAVFVYLFQKYYVTGEADGWMTEKYKKFIFDRGYSLMANTIGDKAANLLMSDTLNKPEPLYGILANYTVICFWDPTCSHCQIEVPKLDSLLQAKWKSKGVQIYGVLTTSDKEVWLKYIREHNLKDWINVYQTQEIKDADLTAGKPGYKQLYDVYQTPMLYLLDKDKRIIAKKLNYEQMNDFLDYKFKSASTN
jgi:Domain of unknown function (DUF5106)/Thioredoxin-like/Domain of unknown function (DUF4369)